MIKYQASCNETEALADRLKTVETELSNIKREANNYQNMLQQSQEQYSTLEKKYNKAKRLLRDFQQRERDMVSKCLYFYLSRWLMIYFLLQIQLQEFYVQNLQEKDTEYNALVKKLKDRVITLEQTLQETQQKTGLPVTLPYDTASLKLTPQMSRREPPKQFLQKLETDFSDTEISDLSPDAEDGDGKTATVERKIPQTNNKDDELDSVVPQHQLLDNSVNKTKKELASRMTRSLPSGKKSHSNSGSSDALDEMEDTISNDSNSNVLSTGVEADAAIDETDEVQYSLPMINKIQTPPNVAALYAQVCKERTEIAMQQQQSRKNHSTIPNIYRNPHSTSYDSELNASYDSDLGSSTDKLDEEMNSSDSWMYPSRKGKGLKGINPPSLAEQLKERLAEREGKRINEDGSSRDSSDDYTELNRTPSAAALLSHSLLQEIKMAVNEAQPKGE